MPIKLIKSSIGLCSILMLLNANATPPTTDALDQLVKTNITAWMKKNQIPGAAVEVYNNGVPHSYYFGYAEQTKKIPVTKKTIFELGSITKLITCLLVAEEVGAGKMKLTDSITNYLPDLTKANPNLTKITIESLATHTTGLPFTTPDTVTTRSNIAAIFNALASHYSNWESMGLFQYQYWFTWLCARNSHQ